MFATHGRKIAVRDFQEQRPQPGFGRQTELRDRYLNSGAPAAQGGLPRAYPASGR